MNGMPVGNVLQKDHLYEQVADLLEQQILNNYEDGARLPSEQHLAEEYSVSRTIIRESLKLLKERGLIDSKTGSGSYVTRPEAQNIADVVYRIIQMDQIDYVSVFDMRMILEMESISRAVNHVTIVEMKEMEHLLELLKDPKLSNEKRSKYDFSFHYMIAKASGNPLLALMTEAIGTICQEMIHKAFLLQDSLQDSIVRHNLIMNAIKARDEKAAKDSMTEKIQDTFETGYQHLENSKRNYEEYLQRQQEG